MRNDLGVTVSGCLLLAVIGCDAGAPAPQAPPVWTELSAASHVCGIVDGKVACWGYDLFQQVGVAPAQQCGSLGCAQAPCALGLDAIAVGAGDFSTCLVDSRGKVACWGDGSFGQLGPQPRSICSDGESNGSPCSATPHVIGGLHDVQAIAVSSHICALTSSNEVWCWGRNTSGQLGSQTREECGSSTCSRTPVRVPIRGVVQIAVGRDTSYAVTQQGDVYCWGSNEWGQCPMTNGDWVGRVPRLSNIAGVAAGFDFACAWSRDGKAWCWGDNTAGIVGSGPMQRCVGSYECSHMPREIAIDDVVEISAGFTHACARKRDGTVFCWGGESGHEHPLGFVPSDRCGAMPCQRTPMPVPGIEHARAVRAGDEVTCVLVDDRVKCWGNNDLGTLGDGTRTDRLGAREIAAPRVCR